jgi:hypothetical protein
MQTVLRRCRIVERDKNVVRVDFGGEPDPPAPKFPGAAGERYDPENAGAVSLHADDTAFLQWFRGLTLQEVTRGRHPLPAYKTVVPACIAARAGCSSTDEANQPLPRADLMRR